MDSPDPFEDASSVALRPDNTPNSDVHASPVPIPSHKNKPQRGQRRVIQKAKQSFIDDNDTSDDEQEHVDNPPTTRSRREVTRRTTDFAEFPKGFKTKPSDRVPEPDTHPSESVVLDVNKVDSRAASVSAHEPQFDDRSCDYDGPMGQGISITTSTAVSPNLHEQKYEMACTFRGSSIIDVDGTDQSLNGPGKHPPVSNTKMKLPEFELEVEEPDDGGQQANAFSLSALPPSTGNSPVANKSERKTATRKRTAKEPAKKFKKQAEKQITQHQKQPTASKSKTQRAAPVDRILEPSSNGEDDKKATMIGSDLQEEQGLARPSMPRQAKFKPLKSPVNTHLAATQDLIYISSGDSDDSEKDDDVEDDDFVPTSSLNPTKDDSIHPKTTAATQYAAVKDTSKSSNTSKARVVNSQRRAEKKKPAKVDSEDGSKPPIAPSNMVPKAKAVDKTRVGETKVKPVSQLKEKSPTTVVLTQSKKASTVRQGANFRTSGSNTQSEQNTVRPKPIPTKSRQTKTGGVGKSGNARQADEAAADYSRNPKFVAFGPKITGKSQKIAKAPVRRSPDRQALPSAEDEPPSATKLEPATVAHEQWKKRATKTEATRHFTSFSDLSHSRANGQRRPAPRQGAGDIENLLPVTETPEEDGAPEPVHGDETRSGERLMNVTSDDGTCDGREAAASEDGKSGYTDHSNAKGVLEPPAENFNSLVISDKRHKQQISTHKHKTAVVPHEKDSPFRDIPARAVLQTAGPKTLKRRFREDATPSQTAFTTNRVSVYKPCFQSASSSSMVSPMDIEPVAKKPRFEAVRTASNSQDEDIVSTDDVFYPEKQGEHVKRTAFVRNCISNEPRDHGATRFEAKPTAREQPVGYSSPTNHRQRVRPLQQPDSVAKRVLAAISAPEANASLPSASNHDPGLSSVQDGERIHDVDDRGRAWKKATEPYGEGIAEILHKSVNVILRSLKTKEDAIHDVVEDYQREGKRIVDKLSSEHEKERKQLVQKYEQYRINYIKVCTEARRQTKATSNDLKLVDLGRFMGRDPAVNRLKELQKALQKPA